MKFIIHKMSTFFTDVFLTLKIRQLFFRRESVLMPHSLLESGDPTLYQLDVCGILVVPLIRFSRCLN